MIATTTEKTFVPPIDSSINISDLGKFLGVLKGFENNTSWIQAFLDWLHNHRAINPVLPELKSDLLMSKPLSVRWDFLIKDDGTIQWDSYETNSTGYGFVPSDETITKLMSIPDPTTGGKTFGKHGHGATATHCYLTHGESTWFIIVKTSVCDSWFVYEKNIYTGVESTKQFMTTEEISNTYSDIDIDRLGESGLFQRMTIVNPTNLKGQITMPEDWYNQLEGEIGTRYRKPINKGLFEMKLDVRTENGDVLYNDIIPAYYDDIVSADKVSKVKWKPGNKKQFDLRLHERNGSKSDAHKESVMARDGKIVGLGGVEDVGSKFYGDHLRFEIEDKDTGVIMDTVEVKQRVVTKGNLSATLVLPVENQSSKTDKSSIQVDVNGSQIKRDELIKSLKEKIKTLYKDTSFSFTEDDLRDNFVEICQGLWYPSAWNPSPLRVYRELFDLIGVPNFNGTGERIKDILKEEFAWCKKHMSGQSRGVQTLNGLEFDVYIKETRTNLEFIPGQLDDKHFHKNSSYILGSQELKEGQHKNMITLFCNSNPGELLQYYSGCVVKSNNGTTDWRAKYKTHESMTNNKTSVDVINLSYFQLDLQVEDDRRTKIGK